MAPRPACDRHPNLQMIRCSASGYESLYPAVTVTVTITATSTLRLNPERKMAR
jgi:hypothetical protein